MFKAKREITEVGATAADAVWIMHVRNPDGEKRETYDHKFTNVRDLMWVFWRERPRRWSVLELLTMEAISEVLFIFERVLDHSWFVSRVQSEQAADGTV